MHGFPCTCVPCQTASEGFRAWETLSAVDSLSSLSPSLCLRCPGALIFQAALDDCSCLSV